MKLDSLQVSLCHKEAQSAITAAVQTASRSSVKAVPEEPDIVACLLQTLAIDWGQKLPEILGIPVRVSSIFCHQSPIVRAWGTEGCELGDLLIVVWDETEKPVAIYGELFQAKKFSGREYRLHEQDLIQLNLYESWPKFEVTRPKHGLRRGVKVDYDLSCNSPAAIYDYSKSEPGCYLVIDWRTQDMSIATPARTLDETTDLSSVLCQLIQGSAGKKVSESRRSDSRWSGLVFDLLVHSFHSSFDRNNIGKVKAPRFQGSIPQDFSDQRYSHLCVVNEMIPQFVSFSHLQYRRCDSENGGILKVVTDDDFEPGISTLFVHLGGA